MAGVDQKEESLPNPIWGSNVGTGGYRLGFKLISKANNVPSSAAQLSITVKVQIPFKGQPNKLLNGWTGAYDPAGIVAPKPLLLDHVTHVSVAEGVKQ